MKNTIKKMGLLLATVIMAVLLTVSASAKEIAPTGQCGDNVYWTFDVTSGELIISGTGAMYDYSYYESPFSSSAVKSLVIESGVTTIGDRAFIGYCTNLENVSIPDSVISIGYESFLCCESLKKITIPDSVNAIGIHAFGYCYDLECVELGIGITNIEYATFYGCESLKKIIIPNEVETISEIAFGNCYSLESLTIGDNVKTIERSAFSNCISLVEVTLPDTVKKVGGSAFENCISLTSVTMGNGISSIEDSTFAYCISLEDINIPRNVKNIGKKTFLGCFSLKDVVISENVEQIEEEAFYGCISLQKILIKNPKIDLNAAGICYTKFLVNNISTEAFIKLYKEMKGYVYSGNYNKADELSKQIDSYVIVSESKLPNLTIFGYDPSTAKVYAEANNIPFKALNDTTDNPITPDTPSEPDEDCHCNCHAGGIKAFFFKFINFFEKLFGKNKICACGVKH